MTQWKPKQLVWVYSEQDRNHYGKILPSNKKLYTIGVSSSYVWVQGEGMGGTAKHLQAAKDLCQDHFNERWQAISEQSESDEKLVDEIDCLKSELDCAIETAFNRGAHEWVKLNYPKHYERLSLNAKHVSEPQPFWKPISEFEKTNGNQCLIVDNGKLLHVEYDAKLGVLMAEMSMYKDGRMKAYKSFHLDDLTHFAEVPNLEASE